jgi:hypothetical protein
VPNLTHFPAPANPVWENFSKIFDRKSAVASTRSWKNFPKEPILAARSSGADGLVLAPVVQDVRKLGITKDKEAEIGEGGIRKRRSRQEIRRSLISPSQL